MDQPTAQEESAIARYEVLIQVEFERRFFEAMAAYDRILDSPPSNERKQFRQP